LPGQSVKASGELTAASAADGLKNQLVPAEKVADILSAITANNLGGVLHLTQRRTELIAAGLIDQVLSSLPQGLFILDSELTILWHTENVREITPEIDHFLNRPFYEIFGSHYELLDDASAGFDEAIRAGQVYQACVCTQFTGTVAGFPLDFFVDGVARTSPARAAYVAGAWGAVASLSPELFLRRRGTAVMSSPIKGTLPLDAWPSALRASAKEVAENIMIVDLVRNDLGRVAVVGSVTVPELLVVRRAPGVWHLVSTVAAQVPVELPTSALLDATFPPASVTGTPKQRARQLLSQWEPHRRGIYCGTIGLASPVAGCELNVAIRTVEFDAAGGAVLGVGGGITADSDPDAEWAECLHKASPIVGLPSIAAAGPAGLS